MKVTGPSVPKNGITAGQFLVYGTLMLLVYTSWVWAGLRPSFHSIAIVIAVLLLAALLRFGHAGVRRDPVCWLGLLFLCYLVLQAINSGRETYFDVGYGKWIIAQPRWPLLPSSFDRSEANQMLGWFFPAWVTMLVVRSSLIDRQSLYQLFWGASVSAGALALFGVIQFATSATTIYGVKPSHDVFFASFAYSNHAAAYFIMTATLSAGFFFHELFEIGRRPKRGRVIVMATSSLFCLSGAILSLSRAGIVLSGLLVLGFTTYGLFYAWKRQCPSQRLKTVAATTGITGFLFLAVAELGDRAIVKQFQANSVACETSLSRLTYLNLKLGDRPLLVNAAWSMWWDHRWFGVGGWGFRHLVGDYVPPAQWKQLMNQGKANVHCDVLQYLVEFGLIGAGLLASTFTTLADAARRSVFVAGAHLLRFGLAASLLVACVSLIDLPFRCPAILYAWLALFSALPRLAPFCASTKPTSGYGIS